MQSVQFIFRSRTTFEFMFDFINTWQQKNSVHTNGVAYDYRIKGASRGISLSVSYQFNKIKHKFKGGSAAKDELNRLK